MGFQDEKLRVQTATSAAKRPVPPKSTTPWISPKRTAPPPGHPLPGNEGKWVRCWEKEGSVRLVAKQEQGYFFPQKKNASAKQVQGDQSDISGAYRRGDLVWMETTKERKAARDRWLYEKSQARKADASDPEAEAAVAQLKGG